MTKRYSYQPAQRYLDAQVVRRDLTARAEMLFQAIWGEPANPRAAVWRPKRKKPGDDPRRMAMRGNRRGLWHDAVADRGGDILDFVATGLCGMSRAREDFLRVLETATDWLGAPSPYLDPIRSTQPPALDEPLDALLGEIADALRPLDGRALSYWRDVRGLDPSPGGLAMRLPAGALARRPSGSRLPYAEREAVAVLGRDRQGRIRALQRIILRPGGVVRDPRLPKFSLGPISAWPPFFASRPFDAARGVLVLAEGPETAAAIWSASGARVLVCGGSMAGRVRRMGRLSNAIIAVDADAPDSPAAQTLTSALMAGRSQGARLRLLRCDGPPCSGYDAADLIREAGGRDRLRALVAEAAAPLVR